MPLNSYQRMTYFDPGLGEEAVCYIGYTGHGAYWIKGPIVPSGRKTREQRDDMLARLSHAIDSGVPPGEIRADAPLPREPLSEVDRRDYRD